MKIMFHGKMRVFFLGVLAVGMVMSWYTVASGSIENNLENLYMNITQTSSGEYLLPDSSTRIINENDLQGFSAQKCCYARNEIYARHGRRFNSRELSDYFERRTWYQGTIDPSAFDDASMLSGAEVENLKTLLAYEKAINGGNTYQLDRTGYNIFIIENDLFETTGNSSEYILPESSTRLIYSSELNGLSAKTCCYARNEIYARHGRQFKSAELTAYFQQKSWYRGTIAPSSFDDAVMLNSIEVQNLKTILAYEKSINKGNTYALDQGNQNANNGITSGNNTVAGTAIAFSTEHESRLYAKLTRSTYGMVISWEYHDYNNDGRHEAFAVVAQTLEEQYFYHGVSIWYVDDNSVDKIKDMEMTYDTCSQTVTYDRYSFFIWTEPFIGGSNVMPSYIFGVRNDLSPLPSYYELDISGNYGLSYDNALRCLVGRTNDFSPGMHSYKSHYFTFNRTTLQFIELGGI